MLKINAVNSQNLPSGVPGDFFFSNASYVFKRFQEVVCLLFYSVGEINKSPPYEVVVGVGVRGWGALCGVSRRGEPHHPRAGGEGRAESAEDEPGMGRRGGES